MKVFFQVFKFLLVFIFFFPSVHYAQNDVIVALENIAKTVAPKTKGKKVTVGRIVETGSGERFPISDTFENELVTALNNEEVALVLSAKDTLALGKEWHRLFLPIYRESAAEKIGKLIPADLVIAGAFESWGSDYRLQVKLIDLSSGEILESTGALITGGSIPFVKERRKQTVGDMLLFAGLFLLFVGGIGLGIRYGMLEDHFREKKDKLRKDAKRAFERLEALENEEVAIKAEATKRYKMWNLYLTEYKNADYRLSDARMYKSVYESWESSDS